MSKYEKTLESWQTKKEEKWSTVEAVLKREGFELTAKPASSHFQYKHPTLRKMVANSPNSDFSKLYGPAGQIVVIKHGNKTYGEYLRRIRNAIMIIRDFEK